MSLSLMKRLGAVALSIAFSHSSWAIAADVPVSCQTLQSQGMRNPCDDGLYCNGLERCDPSNANAVTLVLASFVVSGCVRGRNPCASAGRACNEDSDICAVNCADNDGDGYAAKSCGGQDCNDTDPETFPGNTEICDPIGKDEDCDPDTHGEKDTDGDGLFDAMCFAPPR
ncbi:MAG: putative metal-binding motif-containing protein [Pseudomonadota bacterium]